MLREIDLKEALKLMSGGKTVKCLVQMGEYDNWEDMRCLTLNEYLDGVICLTDVPREEVKEEAMRVPQKPKELDEGKIMALKNAGWTNKKIAEEMGVSEPTISRRITALLSRPVQEEEA